jgi:hypothetical protein
MKILIQPTTLSCAENPNQLSIIFDFFLLKMFL